MALKLFGVSARNLSTIASAGVIVEELTERDGVDGFDTCDGSEDKRPYRFSVAVFSKDCSFSMKNCRCRQVNSFIRRKYPGIISHAIVSASESELAGAVATRAVEGKRETGRVRNEKSDRTPKKFRKNKQ